jgi:hypothetical protein
MTDEELHWLAGLLEGEGHFGLKARKQKDENVRYVRRQIQLNMGDFDVVQKAASLMDTRARGPYGKQRGDNINASGYYNCSLNGDRAVWMMVKLLPLMGSRRSAKIREILPLDRTVVDWPISS